MSRHDTRVAAHVTAAEQVVREQVAARASPVHVRGGYSMQEMAHGAFSISARIVLRTRVAASAAGAGFGGFMASFMRGITLILLTLSMTTGFAQTPAQAPKTRTRQHAIRKKTAAKPPVLPPLPGGPLQQVPMTDLPATAPQVSYQNGALTIVSQNSTMGDILREVHKQTGATIDIPPNANDRVATRLGPGPARDVIDKLLDGSNFNYVIVGTPANPTSLASVVLTPKPAGGATQTASAFQPQPQYQPQQVQAFPAPGMGPGSQIVAQQPPSEDEDAETAEEDPQDDGEQQDQAQDQPNQNNGAQVSPDGTQPPNGGPKTPEQILEMLRQRMPQRPPQQNGGQPPQPPQQVPEE